MIFLRKTTSQLAVITTESPPMAKHWARAFPFATGALLLLLTLHGALYWDCMLDVLDSLWLEDGPPRSLYFETHPELFAKSLSRVAEQHMTQSRGIVLPLFDSIAMLGISLILELRAFGVTLPIEIAHCGDLGPAIQAKILAQDPLVHVYDACALASQAVDAHQPTEKLFCSDLGECQTLFRSFDVKILAVVLSRFQELMLLDADTLFFQNPMELWESPQYRDTGTLFFHDRVTSEHNYLARRVRGETNVSALHQFLSRFDVAPFRHLETLARPKTSHSSHVPLSFEPSEFLLSSHSWNLRTGHEMDSSVVLWNKLKQPRATAILASFIALDGYPKLTRSGDSARSISYGDKECFFIACELAETQYAFSDFGVGAIGWDVDHTNLRYERDHLNDPEAIVCGDALQFFPATNSSSSSVDEPRPLYINSDNILSWDPSKRTIYRSKGLDAEVFQGLRSARGLPNVCMFDVGLDTLTSVETNLWLQRRRLYSTAVGWFAK